MADPKPQTRENHARFHPLFHFFFMPAILILVGLSVYELVHNPSIFTASQVLLIVVVGVAGFLARNHAIKVQDRVIRLEERLRLSTLLPSDLRPVAYALSEQQLIALRFASDEELAALARRASIEKLDSKSIKAAIKSWRPDYWRV